jgi:hypothetical protein
MTNKLAVSFDEFELKLGDSLRRSIDKGLAHSSYGLVVLSPSFFAKEWPQKELDGLTARESSGRKVILPIWHNVDGSYVRKFSPLLADLLAASTSKGIDSIVKEVQRVLKPTGNTARKKVAQKPVKSRLESTLDNIREKDEASIAHMIKDSDFDEIQQLFKDVLDGIAFFNLPNPQTPEMDKNLFCFVESAVVERNEDEGMELFESLLDWYFQTAASSCRVEILKIISRLTRLSFIKGTISRTKRVGSIVADFGISGSFKSARASAESLYNIQSLLSETDLDKIVDYASANSQIKGSWDSMNYLKKMEFS